MGGAIYTDSKLGDTCFYHVIDSQSSNNTVQVTFVGNTAELAGSSIYGDAVTCTRNSPFFKIFNISNTETDPSAIASDPEKVCFCDDNKLRPKCTNSNNAYNTHAFPGQVFPVCLAVVGGGFDGVVTGAVRAYLNHTINATVAPKSQTSDVPFCKNFSYSINLNSTEKITFALIPEQRFFEPVTSSYISVHVNLLDCPLGFSLSPVTGSCVCDPRLDCSNIECNINNQSFLRPANSWIGFINESSAASNKTGVMFHPNCPIGYCLTRDVSVTSNTSDSQCERHRTGLLCGKCEDGYSLTLGNQKCRKCSNTVLCKLVVHVQS